MCKICILTQSHLSRNPRVLKEANALVNAGFQVAIYTVFSDAQRLQEDRQLLAKEVTLQPLVNLLSEAPFLWRLWAKMQFRLGRLMVKRLAIQTPWALGYGYSQYKKKAKGIPADVFVLHQEMALQVGVLLIQQGKKVVVDLEDWYSEDLLPEAQSERPIRLLKKLEKYALAQAHLTYTTSQALAKAMAHAYSIPPPKVIYNSFPAQWQSAAATRQDRKFADSISLLWFSQTIGPGRGLEELAKSFDAIPKQNIELHLRGKVNSAYKDSLLEQFPYWMQSRVFFHQPVRNKELPQRIFEHDIGLALEHSEPRNKQYTISNKLFQYVQAGLLVVATPTQGQCEIADQYPSLFCLAKNKDDLSRAIQDAVARVPKHEKVMNQPQFCFEVQQEKLVGWFLKLKNTASV